MEPAFARLQKSRPGQQIMSVRVPILGVASPRAVSSRHNWTASAEVHRRAPGSGHASRAACQNCRDRPDRPVRPWLRRQCLPAPRHASSTIRSRRDNPIPYEHACCSAPRVECRIAARCPLLMSIGQSFIGGRCKERAHSARHPRQPVAAQTRGWLRNSASTWRVNSASPRARNRILMRALWMLSRRPCRL